MVNFVEGLLLVTLWYRDREFPTQMHNLIPTISTFMDVDIIDVKASLWALYEQASAVEHAAALYIGQRCKHVMNHSHSV